MSDQNNGGEVTLLIRAAADGDLAAKGKLVENMYGDLRRLAGHMMRGERQGHTLQATALVNELLIKLLAQDDGLLAENKRQLISSAATAMRHLLVDHARARRRGKRGGGAEQVTFQPELGVGSTTDDKLLLIHDAMDRLQAQNERHGKVAELKVFGGFSVAEIAAALGVTTRTVDRDWLFVKAWLQTQLR